MTIEPPPGREAGDERRPEPPAEFEREFGEPLRRVLDLATWSPGSDLAALYERLDDEITSALAQEDRVRQALRDEVFPIIEDRSRPGAPPFAGYHQLSVERGSRSCTARCCSPATSRPATGPCWSTTRSR
jgi:hypothetical protein